MNDFEEFKDFFKLNAIYSASHSNVLNALIRKESISEFRIDDLDTSSLTEYLPEDQPSSSYNLDNIPLDDSVYHVDQSRVQCNQGYKPVPHQSHDDQPSAVWPRGQAYQEIKPVVQSRVQSCQDFNAASPQFEYRAYHLDAFPEYSYRGIDCDSMNKQTSSFCNFGNNGARSMPVHPSIHNVQPVPYVYGNSPATIQALPTSNFPLNHYTPARVHSQPITRASYDKVEGQSSQKGRVFPDILTEDRSRDTKQHTGKDQIWFFLLRLLADVTKKWMIAWTGHLRFFRIKDKGAFCAAWAEHNSKAKASKYDDLCRTIRTGAKKGIVMAVPSGWHLGRNWDGLFGFVIEPSFYLGMTREELDVFIMENYEIPPPEPPLPSRKRKHAEQ